MFATGNDVVALLEEIAPMDRAFTGDNSGLQWGDLRWEVPAVLLALDFCEQVLIEALEANATFVFTHHPYLYRPFKKLDLRNRQDELVARALKEDITLFSSHTNLDVAPKGVSHALGSLLGLKKMVPLYPLGEEELEKLVTFVPEDQADKVRDAVSEAGAGWIGNYSHCTYQLLGTGTFLPREGTSPYIGSEGRLETVTEYRLETIMPRKMRKAVLDALFLAHPYEEVAYDLYPLANRGEVWGLGTVGILEKKLSLGELANLCLQKLQTPYLKVLGELQEEVEKIAVLGGSGGGYLESAVEVGAQAFITGDVGFHEAQKAKRSGLALLDAGHEATERPVLELVAGQLQKALFRKGLKTQVLLSGATTAPWQIYE